jgi:hypothetical protein
VIWACQGSELASARFGFEAIPDIGSLGYHYCDSKLKGWFIVRKIIALLFIGAIVAATAVGCTGTTAPKTGGTGGAASTPKAGG